MTNNNICDQSASVISIKQVVESVAGELEQVVSQCEHLQGSIANLRNADGTLNEQAFFSLQEIDKITQFVDNLSHYLGELSQQIPEETSVNVAKAVREVHLHDMAERLSATLGRKSVSVPVEESGDCLFFDEK